MLTNFVKINRCNGLCQFQIQHMLISTKRLVLFQKILNYFGKDGGFGRLNPQHAQGKVWGDNKNFYLTNRACFSDVGTLSNICLRSGLSASTIYTTLLKNAGVMFCLKSPLEVTGKPNQPEPSKDKPNQPEKANDPPNQPEPSKDTPNQPAPSNDTPNQPAPSSDTPNQPEQSIDNQHEDQSTNAGFFDIDTD